LSGPAPIIRFKPCMPHLRMWGRAADARFGNAKKAFLLQVKMKDYAEILNQIQKGLGKAYQRLNAVLNVPGTSVAVKIDPHYYLAVMPGFVKHLAKWSGRLPNTMEETLLRSGNMPSAGTERRHILPLAVLWGEPPERRDIKAAFVLADFLEAGLRMYGGETSPLPVSTLVIHGKDRDAVLSFFEGKTPPDGTAFSSVG